MEPQRNPRPTFENPYHFVAFGDNKLEFQGIWRWIARGWKDGTFSAHRKSCQSKSPRHWHCNCLPVLPRPMWLDRLGIWREEVFWVAPIFPMNERWTSSPRCIRKCHAKSRVSSQAPVAPAPLTIIARARGSCIIESAVKLASLG